MACPSWGKRLKEPVTVGLLTLSDRASRGEYIDRSGALMAKILNEKTSWIIDRQTVIPDDFESIKTNLLQWCEEGLNLILTSGGTGFSPRDITPEATKLVIQRETPGISEALRAESLKITPHAMLSRGVSGICHNTLIINLPGSPKAVRENLDVLLQVLPHAIELMTDDPGSELGHQKL